MATATVTASNGKSVHKSREEILSALAAKTIDVATAMEMLKAFDVAPRGLTIKITDKGCVAVCGLRQFPIALYAGEWERIEELMPKITAFIRENAAKLPRK